MKEKYEDEFNWSEDATTSEIILGTLILSVTTFITLGCMLSIYHSLWGGS